ncbi:Fe2+ transport system protein FeoA [Sporobacter termitidis DSM 10068]|uniref:Fe2+ transport system protein FeoA n=1 Tax=Sporobacter termitidis DSM 10068 TaxID=1123282 RepID=A0A1M5XVI9_9FIRM|nr:FeoA family protein [Sporobacter termitidis]SHI03263.1 Fe2+ transport system protein FeoA [Sporobacter termitidis DSM 10068]
MLLSLAPLGDVHQVKAIWAGDKVKNALEEAGITVDCELVVVLRPCEDSLIVRVKDKRIAISGALARKIIV